MLERAGLWAVQIQVGFGVVHPSAYNIFADSTEFNSLVGIFDSTELQSRGHLEILPVASSDF